MYVYIYIYIYTKKYRVHFQQIRQKVTNHFHNAVTDITFLY